MAAAARPPSQIGAGTVLRWLLLLLFGLIILPWDVKVQPGPLLRDATPTEADEPQNTATYSREVLYFPCSGVRCQAWLYMPKASSGAKPPVVVAAHGLGAQKDFGLAAYGEHFAGQGIASFIFDYRTFGGSDGEPRHWVSPGRHVQDWRSAVAFVRNELSGRVDAARLMLWGTSFGGGHALTLAAELGDAVTAVVAQVPFTDGKATFARGVKERGLLKIARAVIAGLHDGVRSLTSYPAAYFPLTGQPGSLSFMGLTDDEAAAYYAKHPPAKQGGWKNLARCSLALEISRYRPIQRLGSITAPVLYVAATADALCPLEGVQQAVAATRNAQLVTVDCNHFSVYSGEPLAQLLQAQAAFLRSAAGLDGSSAAADTDSAAAGDAAEQQRDEL